MDEEKRRLQATRQEIGDNSGGRRIDLLSGKVRICRDTAQTEDEQAEDEPSGPPVDETDEPDETA